MSDGAWVVYDYEYPPYDPYAIAIFDSREAAADWAGRNHASKVGHWPFGQSFLDAIEAWEKR